MVEARLSGLMLLNGLAFSSSFPGKQLHLQRLELGPVLLCCDLPVFWEPKHVEAAFDWAFYKVHDQSGQG